MFYRCVLAQLASVNWRVKHFISWFWRS